MKNEGHEGRESEKLQMTTEHLKIMRWDIYEINNSKPCLTYRPRTGNVLDAFWASQLKYLK